MPAPSLVVTPAPGAVFLRIGPVSAEMTPAEALRVAEQLLSCARLAIAAQDGRALLGMIAGAG